MKWASSSEAWRAAAGRRPVDASGALPGRVDRIILRTFIAAAVVAGVTVLVAAIVTGDVVAGLSRSAFSGGLALYAGWRLHRRQSAVPVFYVAMLAIVVTIALRQSVEVVGSGTLGVVGLSLAASLLAKRRMAVLAMAVLALGLITLLRWRILQESPIDLIGAAIVPMLVVAFGSQLMEWAKQEITGRQTLFDNLFDHVPVAIWEEDFSDVAAWLDELRARGVTDLRGYLEANPQEVLHGASLIDVVDVNEETMRFLQAPDRASLLGRLNPELVVEDSLVAIVEELVAVWESRPKLRVGLTGANTLGQKIEGYLLMSAPQNEGVIDWSRVVVAMVDMSEQRAAQRRLEELVDSKDQFIASVSHELRTPLTAVIGLAEELRTNQDAISLPERDELLALMAEQAIEVGNIVEDLLIAAQANIGRVKIVPEEVGISGEIDRLVLALDLSGAPLVDVEAGCTAMADPRRLRQVLRNLLSNAYRYGGDHVVVTARSSESSVHIEVTDDGDGIPAELQEKVFEPYETAHRTVGVTGSVGLGLTVSRELARLMGGNLTYVRADGTTVFRLTLPRAAAPARLVS